MQLSQLQKLIEQALPGAIVEVTSPDLVHFEAVVTYAGFAGKSRVQQQQMVYAALQPYIASGEVHALALKTQLPTLTT